MLYSNEEDFITFYCQRNLLFLLGPSYPPFRAAPSRCVDLPPGLGAQIWPFNLFLPGNHGKVPLHFFH